MADAAGAPTGLVVLVGGGPGADDLITVRGLDRLMAADVVIHDRLGPAGLLGRLGSDVEIIDAARAPGRRTLTYDEIVALMIDRARAGKTVVRLKGGDPFVFAHGAQEMRSCAEAGIAVEVVPGVTSATAAPVLAGVPLTSTEGAAGFSVVSGHLDPDDPASRIDWSALSRSGTNLVILMGMRHLPAIVTRLIREGTGPDAAAVCVADASLPSQRVIRARLADLPAAVAEAGLRNPATVIIEAGRQRPGRRVLVLGGSRSGKSRHAERLLAGADAGDLRGDGARRPRRRRVGGPDRAPPAAAPGRVGDGRDDRPREADPPGGRRRAADRQRHHLGRRSDGRLRLLVAGAAGGRGASGWPTRWTRWSTPGRRPRSRWWR